MLGAGVWTFGMQGYQRQRVLTFLYPERDPLGAGYQVRQSKIAVGSGELLGKGYMQGTQSQLRFLPARHTDFILSVLAEEWGFAGVLTVLGLYALYITSAARIAMRARDRAGILLVAGLVSVTCFHVLYNSAMVVGFVPITGIPLPLPLLRRLVHHGELHRHGDHPWSRHAAVREPLKLSSSFFSGAARSDGSAGRSAAGEGDEDDAGDDDGGGDQRAAGQRLAQEQPAEEDRDDRIDVGVRPHQHGRGHAAQQPDVGGEADQGAEGDEIGERREPSAA